MVRTRKENTTGVRLGLGDIVLITGPSCYAFSTTWLYKIGEIIWIDNYDRDEVFVVSVGVSDYGYKFSYFAKHLIRIGKVNE